MKPEIDWTTLNAYVDGELSPATMARVAARVAGDPELARQMAELRRLKSGLYASRPMVCPPIHLEPPRRRRPLLVAALATTALLVTLLAGTFLNRHEGTPDHLLQAMAAHQAWVAGSTGGASGDAGRLLKSSRTRLRLDAYIPDLTPAGLRYDGIRRLDGGGGRGLHVGYRGSHGCRVSLVVFPGSRRLTPELRGFDRDGGRIYGWRVRDNTFYLMAPRMDPGRLAQVARAVYRMTRAYTPLDPAMTLALNQARDRAQPCAV
ncbi:MAG TPA: hypothetical protein ENI96_13070 [Sedimenticola thiotaurini]|uniref:Anti-sigma factor n=1 Tax=Sedimenticola thiotaurini TaxID=1543721 RepID=A0A831RQF6_9GAMM|nr:hypothetical protein [Sedimenticola thiotaurini]